ncbi:hypothetical protein CRM22_000356 [Opisthorchis felineus]|uniref:Dol-P-Glc:Glc(2)Man(9)GlcNAc(2)-PP-Dol alpha-1,2-glucosyltransferase n=1 Tax=Opisthorchis felineus TaxID=147828 RepID=A0A4S2MMC5_OPIFE|nr:hypothetical protein CRM22_000356 [Opisthorchis felineus]
MARCLLVGISLGLAVSCTVLTLSSVLLAYAVTSVQPEAYMDEIFHVRQSLSYLSGNWSSWDNKITTPPGTYVLFVMFYRIGAWLHILPLSPNMIHFRCFSASVSTLNYYVLSLIIPRLTGKHPLILSLVLSTNPVLFFFSALYYTDQCALFFLLATVYFSLQSWRFLGAIACACGIAVRQTNVVWLLFSLGVVASSHLGEVLIDNQKSANTSTWIKRLLHSLTRQPWKFVYTALVGCLTCYCHLVVALLFVLFVFWNGGIVLGDRSAHRAVLHIPQLWYFCVFCSACTPISFGLFVLRFLKRCRRLALRTPLKFIVYVCLFLILVCLIVLTLAHLSHVHPYLLADNRHYTFYIWRRVINRTPLVHYSFSVVYALCFVYWLSRLFTSRAMSFQTFVAHTAIVLCTCACLIPAHLLEFRYFLLPYTIWRLYSSEKPSYLLIELVLNSVVIAVTVYLFLARPFYWASEPGVLQRFMW